MADDAINAAIKAACTEYRGVLVQQTEHGYILMGEKRWADENGVTRLVHRGDSFVAASMNDVQGAQTLFLTTGAFPELEPAPEPETAEDADTDETKPTE